MFGSMSSNFEFFEEELNTGVGWGRGQIKVGFGVGNLFLTPDSCLGQCQLILKFLKRS